MTDDMKYQNEKSFAGAKKCKCLPLIPHEHYCTNRKAGEESELKPCPLCGYGNPRLIDAEEISHRKFSVYVQCGNLGCSYTTALREDSREAREKWNNAWAHKRIAYLENALGEDCYINLEKIAALEARNAGLSQNLVTEIQLRMKAIEQIADLEKAEEIK